MTSTVLLLAAALSLLIGLVLGMLGGGGAILALPMLVYVLGVAPRTAIAMSLFVVGATSLVGAAIHARAKNVQLRLGTVFGAAAMAGAFAGGRFARHVPATVLLALFAALMVVAALSMARRRTEAEDAPRRVAMGRALGLGAFVGAISGLVGAGGGFLIVPALTLFGGVPMRQAVGTSLFVIALQSFAGFAGHVGHVTLDGTLVAVVTGASVLGTVIGAYVGKAVSPTVLRRGFACIVLAMGVFVLGKQLPTAAGIAVGAAAAGASVLVCRGASRRSNEPCTTSPQSPR